MNAHLKSSATKKKRAARCSHSRPAASDYDSSACPTGYPSVLTPQVGPRYVSNCNSSGLQSFFTNKQTIRNFPSAAARSTRHPTPASPFPLSASSLEPRPMEIETSEQWRLRMGPHLQCSPLLILTCTPSLLETLIQASLIHFIDDSDVVDYFEKSWRNEAATQIFDKEWSEAMVSAGISERRIEILEEILEDLAGWIAKSWRGGSVTVEGIRGGLAVKHWALLVVSGAAAFYHGGKLEAALGGGGGGEGGRGTDDGNKATKPPRSSNKAARSGMKTGEDDPEDSFDQEIPPPDDDTTLQDGFAYLLQILRQLPRRIPRGTTRDRSLPTRHGNFPQLLPRIPRVPADGATN